jgi:hypothetical protein
MSTCVGQKLDPVLENLKTVTHSIDAHQLLCSFHLEKGLPITYEAENQEKQTCHTTGTKRSERKHGFKRMY